VQEIYDKRTIHRLVGVSPQNGLSKIDISSKFVPEARPARNTRAAEVVESAWGEADMEPETDEEVQPKRKEEYDDGGRYAIGAPSRKRRKTGGRSDHHVATVFVTDDDGETFGRRSEDSLDEEEREYDLQLDEGFASRPSLGQDRRRSYWLSKGGTSNGIDSS
jgi:non-canonical poly(A) RNA polymerase PAPD5/7